MDNIDYVHCSDEELIRSLSQIDPTDIPPETILTEDESQHQENTREARPQEISETNYNISSQNAGGLIKKYSYHSFADLCRKPEPIPYLIEDYVQEGALLLDYGEYGSGKSFVALDQACTIACSEIDTWHGMKVRHAPVVYFAGEGATGLRKRCALWAYEHGVNPESVQLFIVDEAFHLNDEENEAYSIKNTINNIKSICDTPRLVIIDTLNRYLQGDENKAVDIGKFISACSLIIREIGCTVKIVHHVGNATENKGRPRGSSSLMAAVDIATKYEKVGENHIWVDQTKNKENQCKEGLRLILRQRTLPTEWNDEYSTPTTSCVVELDPSSSHNQPHTPKPEPEKKLTKTQIRARHTYRDAAIESARRLHDERTGHDLAAVDIEDWRKVFYQTSSAEKDNVRRSQFSTARKQLLENEGLLSKTIIEGREYYCLDMEADGEDMLRIAILHAINEREKKQNTHANGAEGGA